MRDTFVVWTKCSPCFGVADACPSRAGRGRASGARASMPRAARRGPHGRAAPSAAVGRRSLVPAWDGAQPHRVDAQQADIRHLADGKARPDPTAPTQNPKTLHPKPYTPRRHARACPRVPARTENAPSRNASAGTSERTRPHIVRSARVGAEQREQDRDHRRVLRARRMRLHRTHMQHMQRVHMLHTRVQRAPCKMLRATCAVHRTPNEIAIVVR